MSDPTRTSAAPHPAPGPPQPDPAVSAGAVLAEGGPGEPGAPTAGSDDMARSTADPRVEDALSRLAELEQLPLAEQVEVFGDIHRRLAAVLADPDSQAQ